MINVLISSQSKYISNNSVIYLFSMPVCASVQLTQWRQFEEEMNPNPSQMSKYFSSPSRSMRSMYSEDEIYYLLGENTSMKRLLNEVDSAQCGFNLQIQDLNGAFYCKLHLLI